MKQPRRIQRKRVRGWKKPANTVNITRPGKWGNPFFWDGGHHIFMWLNNHTAIPVIVFARKITRAAAHEFCVNLFEQHVFENGIFEKAYYKNPELCVSAIRRELKGKNVMCFCKEGEICHGDVLLKIANSDDTTH